MTRGRVGSGLALCAVLLVAGLLYGRSLHVATNYDEQVYLSSLDALVHGQALGRDVYASQPPGFYTLLRAVSLLPGDGVTALRVPFLLIALLGLGAAYAVGHRIAGLWGGLGGAAVLAITAPYPVQAASVQADTASVVLALCAFAVLLYARRNPGVAAAAGALAGAAVSVKLLALPIIVPFAVLLVGWRSWRLAGAVAIGAATVWAGLLIAYAGALPDLWQSVVTDHRLARELGPSLGDNVHRVLLHPIEWQTPAGLLVPIGLVCAVLLKRRIETLALFAWIAASAAFLVYQQPLFDHHMVLIATALAVTAGTGLGALVERTPEPARIAVVGIGALLLAAGIVQEERRLARQDGEPAAIRAVANELHSRTTPDELVGTDLPIIAYLADRRVPGQFVDTSYVRLGIGSLTDAEILSTLARDNIRAVAVGRTFADRPELERGLAARYPTKLERDGITLYLARRS